MTLLLFCVAGCALPGIGASTDESSDTTEDADDVVSGDDGDDGDDESSRVDLGQPAPGGDVPDGTTRLFPGSGPDLFVGDGCFDAFAVTIGENETFYADGSMVGAHDDEDSFCAADNGVDDANDVVLQFTTTTACTLSMELESTFDAALSIRTECETDLICFNSRVSESEVMPATHYEAGTYYVVISDVANEGGDLTLGINCATPSCGDRAIGPGEQCDDGNSTAGDGCFECQFEAADLSIDTCAGASVGSGVAIGIDEVMLLPSEVSRTTVGATDSGTGSCMYDSSTIAGSLPSADHVYKIVPSADGNLTLTLGNDATGVPYCGADTTQEPQAPFDAGCYDRSMHVREGICNDPQTEVACADSWYGWWDVETLTLPVISGHEYYVFVDGWLDFGDGSDIGEYVLQATLTAPE